MDEQIEVEVRDAYLRGWRDGVETMIEDYPDALVAVPHKDAMNEGCGEFLAEWNAHSVIAGKVAELTGLLAEAQLLFALGVGAMTDNGDKDNQERCVRDAGELNLRISKALAPYPERR